MDRATLFSLQLLLSYILDNLAIFDFAKTARFRFPWVKSSYEKNSQNIFERENACFVASGKISFKNRTLTAAVNQI